MNQEQMIEIILSLKGRQFTMLDISTLIEMFALKNNLKFNYQLLEATIEELCDSAILELQEFRPGVWKYSFAEELRTR